MRLEPCTETKSIGWIPQKPALTSHPRPIYWKPGNIVRDYHRESERMGLTLHFCEILMRWKGHIWLIMVWAYLLSLTATKLLLFCQTPAFKSLESTPTPQVQVSYFYFSQQVQGSSSPAFGGCSIMLKSPVLATTDWSFLFVHSPLPGQSGDLNLFKQLQVVGVTKENKSTKHHSGVWRSDSITGQLQINTVFGLLYANQVTRLFTV